MCDFLSPMKLPHRERVSSCPRVWIVAMVLRTCWRTRRRSLRSVFIFSHCFSGLPERRMGLKEDVEDKWEEEEKERGKIGCVCVCVCVYV